MAVRTISGEADLWELLEKIVSQSPGIPDIDEIDLQKWMPEIFYFPEEKVGHAFYPGTAQGLVQFHASMWRAAALLLHGRADQRKLTAEQRKALEIKFVAGDGSSRIEVLLDSAEAFTKEFAKELVAGMTPNQKTAALIIFLLLVFGAVVSKDWMSNQYDLKNEELQSEERIQLSQQETKRMEVFAKALEQTGPRARELPEIVAVGREALVKSVTDQGVSRVLGVELTGEQAQVITSKPHEDGKGKSINADFTVIDISNQHEAGYLGVFKRVDNNDEISAEINMAMLPPRSDCIALLGSREKKCCRQSEYQRMGSWRQNSPRHRHEGDNRVR